MAKVKKTNNKISRDKIEQLVRKLFKDDYGNPFDPTPTELDIIFAVATKSHNRIAILCPTQYGKSTAIAMGAILRAFSLPEDFTIVAPTEAKTKIIMSKVISHIFDSEVFISQLAIDGKIEQLRRERNREKITFKKGGSIRILTANAANQRKLGMALVGEGGTNVILDDSPIIDDPLYSFVVRMIGGHKNGTLIETGNAINLNHFNRAMKDPAWRRIYIDYKVAIQEGRFTEEYISEIRRPGSPLYMSPDFFRMFYECIFADKGKMDDKGWTFLINENIIEAAFVRPANPIGDKILGVDIGGGSSFNAAVIRQGNFAKLALKDLDPDEMSLVGKLCNIIDREQILPENVFIEFDYGRGVYYRLIELGRNVNKISEGSAPNDPMYLNRKAELNFMAKEWLEKVGVLENNPDFKQGLIQRWKPNSTGKFKMMSKPELKGQGIDSPDVWDALCLTMPNYRAQVCNSKNPSAQVALGDTSRVAQEFGNDGYEYQ